MGIRSTLSRFLPALSSEKGATPEANQSAAAYPLPRSGGFIPSSWPVNFWQQGRDPITAGPNSTVHACVDAYAQTLASMAIEIVEVADDGSRKVLKSAHAARVLRRPNRYQTRSDFTLNLVKALLLSGNAYVVATRNERHEIAEMHLLDSRSTQPLIEPETNEVFYALGSNPLLSAETIQALAPARDILHLRLYTPRHPLIGVSPIENLAASIATNNAIHNSQAAFHQNMARPSGVLTADKVLNRDQMNQLREAWEDQSQGINAGRVPILGAGMKWEPLSLSSEDAQTIATYQMTVTDIARAFRVPPPVIGVLEGATYSNAEQTINFWLSTGLGFMVEHLERAFEAFFDLPDNRSVQVNVDALLRTDLAGRMEALARAVQGGIYSPNEARRKEGLPPAEYGEEPRLQAQVVPLSQIAASSSAPSATDQNALTELLRKAEEAGASPPRGSAHIASPAARRFLN